VAFDVVIAGGGFGGLYAARRLERRLPRHSGRIRIVSDVNFLLYSPLLPGASAELGQLGHPPALGDYLEDMSRSGETGER
jgi:NADH dehydrogenase FAD-containing subunit